VADHVEDAEAQGELPVVVALERDLGRVPAARPLVDVAADQLVEAKRLGGGERLRRPRRRRTRLIDETTAARRSTVAGSSHSTRPPMTSRHCSTVRATGEPSAGCVDTASTCRRRPGPWCAR